MPLPSPLPPPPPPALSIGEAQGVTISRAAIAVRGRHATVTLVLTSAARTRHEVALPLAVPHTAAVTAMTVVEGDHRTPALALTPMRARDRYDDTVSQVVDPVLLEHSDETRTEDALTLRVFPLAKVQPVTVEIELELGDGPTLVLEPGAHGIARVEIDTNGRPIVLRHLREPYAVALPDRDDAIAPAPALSLVTERSSLYAEPRLDLPAMPKLASAPPGLRSARDVRDGIRRNAATLEPCADVDPRPRARSFVIAADGTVAAVAGATTCLADQIRRWRFAPAREATRVDYPLSSDVAAQ